MHHICINRIFVLILKGCFSAKVRRIITTCCWIVKTNYLFISAYSTHNASWNIKIYA